MLSASLAVTVTSAFQVVPETVSVIFPPRVSRDSWVLSATRSKVALIRCVTSSDGSPYFERTASSTAVRTLSAPLRLCTTYEAFNSCCSRIRSGAV